MGLSGFHHLPGTTTGDHNQVTCQRLSLYLPAAFQVFKTEKAASYGTFFSNFDKCPLCGRPHHVPASTTGHHTHHNEVSVQRFSPMYLQGTFEVSRQKGSCPDKCSQCRRPHHVPGTTTGDHTPQQRQVTTCSTRTSTSTR